MWRSRSVQTEIAYVFSRAVKALDSLKGWNPGHLAAHMSGSSKPVHYSRHAQKRRFPQTQRD